MQVLSISSPVYNITLGETPGGFSGEPDSGSSTISH